MAFTGDNATSNDKQTDVLHTLPNTFEELSRVRCFNHTMQLSVKALLKPFSSAGSVENDNETDNSDDSMPALQAIDDEEDKDDTDEDEDDEEEEEDPLDALDDEEREALMNNTEAVHTTLNKVCLFSSFIAVCCLYMLVDIGPQTLLRYCSFYYYCSPCMARSLCLSFSSCTSYPSRCQNSMELDI